MLFFSLGRSNDLFDPWGHLIFYVLSTAIMQSVAARFFKAKKVWQNFVGDTEFNQVADDSANFHAISGG